MTTRKPLLPAHVASELLRERLSVRILRELAKVTPAQAATGLNVWFLAVESGGRWANGMTVQSALNKLNASNPKWLLVYRVESTTPPQFDGLTVTRTPPGDAFADGGLEEILLVSSKKALRQKAPASSNVRQVS